jgi:hypothetical protein
MVIPLKRPFMGPLLLNSRWNFNLSAAVRGGKPGGGGDLGKDIPVFCLGTMVIPSMTGSGPADITT